MQAFELRVRLVDELIHLLTQCVVFIRQPLREMFLVDDLLRALIAVEG